jgi:hypothetical protein
MIKIPARDGIWVQKYFPNMYGKIYARIKQGQLEQLGVKDAS